MKYDTPVVILCGGYGTRLSEETYLKPKPMIEIGEYPILYHIMKHFSFYGYKRFILALGYKGNHIKLFFYNYRITLNDFTMKMDPRSAPDIHAMNGDIDWEVTFVDTGVDTLKGGRLKRLESYIDSERFFMTYGDAVSNIDLNALYDYHMGQSTLVTLTGVNPPSRFGELKLHGERVTSFNEKPQLSMGVINGGYMIYEKAFMNYLSEDKDCDLEFGALQTVAEQGQLSCFQHGGFWQCMDTLREKNYLEKLWASGSPPWKLWD